MKRALVLALVALWALGETPPGPMIFRPADQSVIQAGPVSVVAKGPADAKLELDGKPVEAQHPAAGVFAAIITPTAGRHQLSLAGRSIQFFVGASGVPEGWKQFRAHPPAAVNCETCHAVNQGAWDFKGGTVAENCFECHQQQSFPKVHQHNPEVLADCQLCHNPHGSTAKFHLKMAKETACKQCHG